MNKILEALNENQAKSVITVDKPLRIIAGAGSGKTKVITTKIAYLINEIKVESKKILAVTFTNKAANEMKERVTKILEDSNLKTSIFTFHGLCARILSEDYSFAGLQRNFTIIDQGDKREIIKNAIDELAISSNLSSRKFLSLMVSKISEWKNDEIKIDDLMQEALSIEEQNQVKIFKRYLSICKEQQYLDFDDLQIFVVEMFRNNPAALKKWQLRFDYILVDEFQDTNDLQYNLIKMILRDQNKITVVGDPDQTIYTWRGARVDIIMNFCNNFPNVETVVLNQNYRSTQKILDLANDFIANNKNREKKDIFTDKKGGSEVTLKENTSRYTEATWVAKKIKSLTEEGFIFSDIFILYRVNAWSQELEKVLENMRIPYQLIGSIKFRERKVIKDAMSWLKAFVLRDYYSIERALKTIPKIGPTTIKKIFEAAAMDGIDPVDFITQKDTSKIKAITRVFDLEQLHKNVLIAKEMIANNCNVEEISRFINVNTNFQSRVETAKNEESNDNEYLNALYDQMASFDRMFNPKDHIEENKVLAFLREEAISGDGSETETNDKVTLLTIHSAKGLENKVVFICGINKDIFPSKKSLFDISKLEEERRAFYVAMTRAKEKLFISYVNGESSYLGGKSDVLSPSRFIKEMDANKLFFEREIQRESHIQTKFKNKIEIANPLKESQKLEMQVGDIVTHAIFGEGVIVAILNGQFKIAYNNQSYGTLMTPIGNPSIKKK